MNKETKQLYNFFFSSQEVERLICEGFNSYQLADWLAIHCGSLIMNYQNPFPELNYALVDYQLLSNKLIEELQLQPTIGDYIQNDYLDGFYNFD